MLRVFLLTFFTLHQLSMANICLEAPRCYCSKNYTEIYCKNVPTLTPIENFTSRFPKLHSLRILNLEQTAITTPIFKGQSIAVLDVSGPLSSISNDALSGIRDLKVVNFRGTAFTSIPRAFSSDVLTTVQMVQGALEGIDDSLQNNTGAMELLFGNNRISKVSPDAFKNVAYLMYLNLSGNQLSFLDRAVFGNFRQLKSIDLSHNKLLSMDGFLKYLDPQEVNYYGNSLSSVENAFHPNMENMKWLNLGGNPNLKLNASIFQGMKHLLELDISDSNYDALDPDLFANFNKLHTLILRGNNFSSIPPGIIQYGSHLSTLDLSDNSLSSVEELFPLNNTEYQIHTLKTVDLSGNDIQSIGFGMSSKSVQRLDLSRNRIAAILGADLANVTSLTSLNVSSNPLKRLDPSCFRNQERLEVLDLSNTEFATLNHSIRNLTELEHLMIDSAALENVDEIDFQRSISLKIVSLRRNRLNSLNGAMRSLVELTKLDISLNNLTTLTADTFPAQKKLKWLWMEGNPWMCDCKISWLVDWIKAKLTSLKDNPVCHSPPNLQDIPLRSLNHSILTTVHQDCPTPCDCKCVPNDHDAIVSVDCSNKSLNKAPDHYPLSTKEVYLNGNNLEEFVLNAKGSNISQDFLSQFRLSNRNKLKDLDINTKEVDSNNKSSVSYSQLPEELNSTNIKKLEINTKENNWSSHSPDYPLQFKKAMKSKNRKKPELNPNKWYLSSKNPEESELNVNHGHQSTNFSVGKSSTLSLEDLIGGGGLEILDLTDNHLKKVELGVMPKVLRLSGNNLSRLGVEGWTMEGVREVTLAGNQWICDCAAWSFVEWLAAHKDLVKDIHLVRCGSGEFISKIMINLTRDEMCRGYFSTENTILISAAATLFAVLCLCACVFRYSLGAVLYACGASCLKTRERGLCSFDAFLLFADADEDFAIHTIAAGLENSTPPFKLFIPTRQVFLTTESVDVVSSVNDCSKIIVILSRAFLEDPQCMQLLKTCISSCGTNTSTRLIFIITRAASGLEPDPVLGSVIRNSTTLRWGQVLFWKKLRYCMPRKDTRRRGGWEELLRNE